MSTPNIIRSEKIGSTLAFRSAFEVLDGDGDGKISKEDLKRFFEAAFYFPNATFHDEDEIIRAMISLADSNSDGFVEYDEFERLLGLLESKQTAAAEVMGDAFKVMDKDGDGRLSYEDLKNYMRWADLSAEDEDIKAVIRFCDSDDDNNENEGVSFDGLLKILGVDFAA
ncbi:putative DNA replication complex GINS protein SLD5 [Hibiscus syriacus]|uniref:DNA replication complex GINS protein SLD5 n=1 Tax=Hibiscus syriacus TaxID=106335 RepID=A0A6A3CUY1_HIBSY|nr:calcium-binding protein CP1-like [Hibiscus syriacus]KAE8730961.1 putative DNA replication complex GINS protein SLD5 [Hibiscus syriacus]